MADTISAAADRSSTGRTPASLEVITDRAYSFLEDVHPFYAGSGEFENAASKAWDKLERVIHEAVIRAGHFDAADGVSGIVYTVAHGVTENVIRLVHESGRARA